VSESTGFSVKLLLPDSAGSRLLLSFSATVAQNEGQDEPQMRNIALTVF
jgi:hypothetical protein